MDYFIDGIRQYVNFRGRTSRKGYWMFVLFQVLISVIVGILDGILNTNDLLYNLTSLFFFIPSISISVRRMHDINKSGSWVLINLIPVIGWIWFIILACKPSVDN